MALQFLAAHGDDTLVLYQPAVGQPMIEAMRWVTAWQKQWKERKGNGMDWDDKNLHRTDELRIPEISLSAYDDFSDEFKGTLWFKSSKQPQQISQAATEVMLKVDGAGVKFTASETYQGVDPFAVQTVDPVPRRFWFDRPFFAFLWRDGAEWPHAAVWFGSSEGLGHL